MIRLIALILLASTLAHAESVFIYKGSEISKLEALKHGLNHETVLRCNEVQLTDKATFKSVKKAKSQQESEQ